MEDKQTGSNRRAFSMKNLPLTAIFSLLLLLPLQVFSSNEVLKSILNEHGTELVLAASGSAVTDSRTVFRQYAVLVAGELEKAGQTVTARSIRDALDDPSNGALPKDELAWIIHSFARDYYHDDIVRATAELIRFRTYATDVPNRLNPEFAAQKEYLRQLAEKLGLSFNDVDGFVQEIWIGDGDQSFGVMSHSDVQPVIEAEWSHNPWGGEVIDGEIWGRGSVDDKGPICAVLYGMRAILDSGIPLRRKVILLVGTDEESANEDVATYLSGHAAPDQTIVVDSNFPVVCAEKGWAGFWLSLPRGDDISSTGLRVADLHSGFSPSIVPESAVAKLVETGSSADDLRIRVEQAANSFMESRAGSDLRVATSGDTVVVTAHGKSVHSSVPASGHNALMDLLVFLTNNIHPARNSYGLLAEFATRYIGFELDGKSLGIAHHDDFMGDLTVAADMFYSSDTSVTFMFNIRRPRGLPTSDFERAIQERFDEFGKAHGVVLTDQRYIGEPHYRDPESPFVRELLSIYNDVTGEDRKAASIGGGTYAQRLPNAVVFGPALPDEEYLGHQPDERFRISTLSRNIEILTHAMVMFAIP